VTSLCHYLHYTHGARLSLGKEDEEDSKPSNMTQRETKSAW